MYQPICCDSQNQVPVRQPSQMERLVKELQEQVGRLSGLRNCLHDRIETVLSPSKPSPTSRPPSQVFDFPLGQVIKSQVNELAEIGDSLEDFLDRMGI